MRKIPYHIIFLSWHIFTFSYFYESLTYTSKINSFATNNNFLKDTVDFTDDLVKTWRCWNNGKGAFLTEVFCYVWKMSEKKRVTYLISKWVNKPAVESPERSNGFIYAWLITGIFRNHFFKMQVLCKELQLYVKSIPAETPIFLTVQSLISDPLYIHLYN